MAADYSHFLKSSEKRRKECTESCTEFVFGMGESRVMFRWASQHLELQLMPACDIVRGKNNIRTFKLFDKSNSYFSFDICEMAT